MSEKSESNKRVTRQSQLVGEKVVAQFHLLFFDSEHSYSHIDQIKCSRKSKTEIKDSLGNITNKTFVTLRYSVGGSVGEIVFSGTLKEIKEHMKTLPLTPVQEENRDNESKGKYTN